MKKVSKLSMAVEFLFRLVRDRISHLESCPSGVQARRAWAKSTDGVRYVSIKYPSICECNLPSIASQFYSEFDVPLRDVLESREARDIGLVSRAARGGLIGIATTTTKSSEPTTTTTTRTKRKRTKRNVKQSALDEELAARLRELLVL